MSTIYSSMPDGSFSPNAAPEGGERAIASGRASGTDACNLRLLGLGYPHLHGSEEEQAVQPGVRELLGPINERIVGAAVEALQQGSAERMGALMLEAQAEFDLSPKWTACR